MPAILSHESARIASCHVPQPWTGDGIVDARCSLCASQAPWLTTTRRTASHCSRGAFVRIFYTSGRPRAHTAAQIRGSHAPLHPCAACADHLLRARTVRPRVCACAPHNWLVFEAGAFVGLWPRWMQKERPESVQVRPRTAIERVPSPATQPARMLTLASQPNRAILVVRGAGEQPRLRGVEGELWACRRGRGAAHQVVWRSQQRRARAAHAHGRAHRWACGGRCCRALRWA